MTRSVLISTLAAAALAVLPGAASAKSLHCGTHDFASSVTTSQVRVFSTVGDDFGSIYYACWRKTGRSHRLAVNTGGAQVYDAYVENVQVQGKFVGFTYDARGDAPNNYDEFVVVDATTGKRVHDLKIPVPADSPPRPTAIALTPTGTMAAVYWTPDGVPHFATAS
jgi:hypothetical protein